MRNGKLDKIKEWVKANRLYLIQAGCVIAIAVIVAAIMIPDIAVTKGHLEATVDRFDLGISHIGSEIADLSNVVQSIDNDLGAAEDKVDDYDDVIGTLQLKADAAYEQIIKNRDNIAAITDNVASISGNITSVEEALAALNTTAVDMLADIAAIHALLAELAEDHADDIEAVSSELDTINDNIALLQADVEAICSPPEPWLTGSFNEYVLHAESCLAGDYTVTVTLGYTNPVALSAGNHTAAMDEFYASIDWDEAEFAYIPALSYDGEDWVVTAISFSIGVFELEAGVEKAIDVAHGGIHEDFAPDWAYVEIWPVWKE